MSYQLNNIKNSPIQGLSSLKVTSSFGNRTFFNVKTSKKEKGFHSGIDLIGGKTGTAQKYENGVIAQGKYVSSFIGFAPADNPKYAILLTVDEPSGYAYYGSIVSAPYVGQIFAKIFDYLQIQPTVTEEIEYALMPNLVGKTLTDAIKILDENDITYEIDGDGEVVSATYPSFNEKISNKDVILVKA